jgi:hypothetical protein
MNELPTDFQTCKAVRANQTVIMPIPFDPEEREDTRSEVAQNWKREIARRIEDA